MAQINTDLFRELFTVPGLRERWEKHVSAATLETGCHVWLGAISDRGHGRFWLGHTHDGRNITVAAHRVGYALHYGIDALLAHEVIRHLCDEPSCQTPTHWLAGTIQENTAEWGARRHTPGSPLRDTRGPRGRATALRTAALNGDDLDTAASQGIPATDWLQDTLDFTHPGPMSTTRRPRHPDLLPDVAYCDNDPYAFPHWYGVAIREDDWLYPRDSEQHVWECGHRHGNHDDAIACAIRYTEGR